MPRNLQKVLCGRAASSLKHQTMSDSSCFLNVATFGIGPLVRLRSSHGLRRSIHLILQLMRFLVFGIRPNNKIITSRFSLRAHFKLQSLPKRFVTNSSSIFGGATRSSKQAPNLLQHFPKIPFCVKPQNGPAIATLHKLLWRVNLSGETGIGERIHICLPQKIS